MTTVALGIAVFLLTLLTDVVWARYTIATAKGNPLIAATWSVGIIAFGGATILSYVNDWRMIIPACAGAFVGTYIAVRMK